MGSIGEDHVALKRRVAELEDLLHQARATEKAMRHAASGAEARAEKAEQALSRVQHLPELDWATASSIIVQGLALHARSDQPAAQRMLRAMDDAKTHVDRLQDRAEQAERERDEARALGSDAMAKAERYRQERDDTNAARERAEADNAALRSIVRRIHLPVAPPAGCDICEAMADATHPGAALLERLRAAEAMRLLASHDEACQLNISGAKDTTNCAACAFDALEAKG